MPNDLPAQIGRKAVTPDRAARKAATDPTHIPELIDGLRNAKPAVRYGCSKALRLISAANPGLLYPRMPVFVALLDADSAFLQWDAARILANLAAIDTEGRFEAIFDRYFSVISGPVMITAANAIGSAARVALARPELADRIARKILRVQTGRYKTAECRNIALGHAIDSLDTFYDRIADKEPVLAMVRKQVRNSRNSTRKKAERFLRRHRLEEKIP